MTVETHPHRLVYYLKSFNLAIVDEIIGISEDLVLQESDSSELHGQIRCSYSCTIPNESHAGFVSE
jgi:hypothetical protein